MERDLSKCFDMVPQAVGEAALAFTQPPGKVRAVARATWSAPRTCQVAGVIANKPIWPSRSIARGDSSSPKSLCKVLSPWSTEGSKFLFMDDRSIVAADEGTLARDLASTDAFDWETGALENASKRQVWRRGDNSGDQTHRDFGGARQAGCRDQASRRQGEVFEMLEKDDELAQEVSSPGLS